MQVNQTDGKTTHMVFSSLNFVWLCPGDRQRGNALQAFTATVGTYWPTQSNPIKSHSYSVLNNPKSHMD